MARTRWWWVGLALLVSGCGVQTSVDPVETSGDPGYAFAAIHKAYRDSEYVGPPTLLQSLPNHAVVLPYTDRATAASDVVVVGRVTSAEEGVAVVWGEDEDDFEVVDFDDPRANTRTVLVTVDVEAEAGTRSLKPGPLTFSVAVPSRTDRDAFRMGLAGAGRVAVLLSDSPSRTQGVGWRPIRGDAALGQVDADGGLHFPGLGGGEGAWLGGIQTVDQLLAAARAPEITEQVDIP